MYKITIITPHNKKVIYAQENENLLKVFQKNHIEINASCSGMGRCKKCKVSIDDKIHLACSVFVNKDMTICLDELSGKKIEGLETVLYDYVIQDGYGIAVDIGTTTIAFYLVDLQSNIEIDSFSELNKQYIYGADVISRINQAVMGNLLNLHQIIISQVNDAISNFKEKHQINIIKKVIVSANTTMLHLFANISPKSIGYAPFVPEFLESLVLDGEKLKVDAKTVVLMPSISAFVGSDIVSGILASRLFLEEGSMLIDIGTNGEMALNYQNQIYACSTAAGPAFEGTNIECGLGGINGAITKCSIENNHLSYEYIGNKPKGICGSGLVDLVALLLKEDLIDETGAINYQSTSIFKTNFRENKFYLTDEVYLSQKDIREFQLAKSAIFSGLLTLLYEAKCDIKSINKIYLAGGFGFYMNITNAVRVGLILKELSEKIVVFGNSSALGAKMVLANPANLKLCEEIAKQVKTIDLTSSKVFMDCFVENMMFSGE